MAAAGLDDLPRGARIVVAMSGGVDSSKGGQQHDAGQFPDEKLADAVGKDLAKKAIEEGGGEYSGVDLKVGGEGMRGFYDKILVYAAKKLGKKFGAKVGRTKVESQPSDGYRGPAVRGLREVHSLDITPQMRESVMQGQAIIQRQKQYKALQPATGAAAFGTACGTLDGQASETGLVTSHSVNVTGLRDNTTDFFRASATNDVGNSGINDNNGQCFTFGTPDAPDYFTEEFIADNDLDFQRLTFTPNGTIACAR